MAPLPELKQLNAIRLRNDWSIRQLRLAMAAGGVRISERTLQYLLMKSTIRHKPFDRTLYKIRVYLAIEATTRRERPIERAARKAAAI